ncbi:hypothetical protein [Photobacterium sanguinicancri]|uniref:Asparaginyl-tRNA synthetase n=1 Tax=Photobacterium sanguinicancri TaxID=875932 RepID=A0ABX4G186_9GAMM|nr:hypothetical protein [Photobacterium sanguinicancri]MDO6498389.1 hypothetical protein [Photobacterium sanguinicancri]OZS44360.1 hypothetical protein ASV53_08495 [Photobacterium sanguinicancri]
MEERALNSEVKLIAVAVICAFLLIAGHVILAKSFAYMMWSEYIAAAIPFILFFIAVAAVKYTIRLESNSDSTSSH